MVSVNNPIPDLSAGPVDWPAWAELLVAEREHLRPAELVHVVSWLESNAPDTLAFGLELAALVAELNMDQSSVQAALLYRGLRNGIYDREDIVAEFGDQTAFIAQSVAQMANASLLELSKYLSDDPAVLVGTPSNVSGILTCYDLLHQDMA